MAFIGLCAAACAQAAEPKPSDFAYAAPIEAATRGTAYRVPLPEFVYSHATRRDLGDLRVFDARDEIIPHLIRQPADATIFDSPGTPLPIKSQRDVSTPQALLSYVADATSVDQPITALELEWPEDDEEFAGRVRVEASEDGNSWRVVVQEAPVANLRSDGSAMRERRVEFAPTRARWWRLSWAGPAPSFALTGVRAWVTLEPAPAERRERTAAGSSQAEHSGDFMFDLGAPLPVDRVNLQSLDRNTIFRVELAARATANEPWMPLGSHGFYRFETRNGEMTNGASPVRRGLYRYVLAKMDLHGGLGPTSVPRLVVQWIPDEIVFAAQGEPPFRLSFASSTVEAAMSPPGLVAITGLSVAKLGEPHELQKNNRLAATRDGKRWQRHAAWGAIAAGGFLLMAWLWHRRRRANR